MEAYGPQADPKYFTNPANLAVPALSAGNGASGTPFDIDAFQGQLTKIFGLVKDVQEAFGSSAA